MSEVADKTFDVVIVGAGFSGLTLAHHLPRDLSVLLVDRKARLDVAYESTGLVTVRTKELLASFLPGLDEFIPNRIDTIAVIGTDFTRSFFSSTRHPWIFSTDTPSLVAYMGNCLPKNITLLTATTFEAFESVDKDLIRTDLVSPKGKLSVKARFLVGGDGGRSRVAMNSRALSKNTRFLFGYEKVFFGDITFGDRPDTTVYHYWFGEFSLGYGGWLSPTTVRGKRAFRIGLAKLGDDATEARKLDDFIDRIEKRGMIRIANEDRRPDCSYGGYIPINGPLKTVYADRTLLLGDAAGFCGAFAADGIKGALVSAMAAAELIPTFIVSKDASVFGRYKAIVNQHDSLMRYFRKQKLYRFIWNQMRRNSTYDAMFALIARDRDSFISQFSDAKNSGGSLVRIVLKPSALLHLLRYGLLWLRDFLFRRTSQRSSNANSSQVKPAKPLDL